MKNKGFTLIELLVVISIIAILAAMAIFGLGTVFENSRNARRKSDIKQYQSSLESYANANNSLFPSRPSMLILSDIDGGTNVCTTHLGLSDCPEDPNWTATSGWTRYTYDSNGSGSGLPVASEYWMWAQLEASTTTYWVVCSNGKSGTYTGSVSSLSSCPL